MIPSRFAIIGGGLTGTAMLVQFVHELLSLKAALPPDRISIGVIDRHRDFGPGFPHSDRYMMPFHLINMCAADMGILAGNMADFESWVTCHKDVLGEDPCHGEATGEWPEGKTTACRHYPRALMGAYLKDRFQEAVRRARTIGITVDLYPQHEVIDINETTDAVNITVENLRSGDVFDCSVHRVLLATGHWCRTGDTPRVIPSPWPAQTLLEKMPSGADVAILGTSLTAVDTVLTLTSDGSFHDANTGELVYRRPQHPRKITLYSRRGLLPAVRGRVGPYKNRYFSSKGLKALSCQRKPLLLEDLFNPLDKDLTAAYGRPFDWQAVTHPSGTAEERLEKHIQEAAYGDHPDGDIRWQTVLQQAFPVVRELYLAFPHAERERFERHYSTLFFVHAAPMPLINARKLLALMKAGLLSVVSVATSLEHRTDQDRRGVNVFYKTPGGKEKGNTHDYLVDARGQVRSYDTNPDRLAMRLLRSRTVMIEPAIKGHHAYQKAYSGSKFPGKPFPASRSGGSLWVDPLTHRVKRTAPNGEVEMSERIYAVGAMTRGQIIDASMARGSAVSTGIVAKDWAHQLPRVSARMPPA